MRLEKKQKIKADPVAEAAAKKAAGDLHIKEIKLQFSKLQREFDDIHVSFKSESGLTLALTADPPTTPPVRYTQNFVLWEDCFMSIVDYNTIDIARLKKNFEDLGLIYPWS